MVVATPMPGGKTLLIERAMRPDVSAAHGPEAHHR